MRALETLLMTDKIVRVTKLSLTNMDVVLWDGETIYRATGRTPQELEESIKREMAQFLGTPSLPPLPPLPPLPRL